MLKFPILVKSITNLSDARYCAGMGVEMLGFCFDPLCDEYIEETLFMGIMGWISGVKVVAECNQMPIHDGVEIATKIKADYILAHTSMKGYEELTSIPIIYRVSLDESSKNLPPNGSYLLVETPKTDPQLKDFEFIIKDLVENHHYKIILSFGFDKNTIEEIYHNYHVYGFALEGGIELSPGLKSFDELADILEAIES